ncbi:MAG: hypothetical protein ACLFWB_03280 [Armatimonadota bacterium]
MSRIAIAFGVLLWAIHAAAAAPVFTAEAEQLDVAGATEETKYAEDASDSYLSLGMMVAVQREARSVIYDRTTGQVFID